MEALGSLQPDSISFKEMSVLDWFSIIGCTTTHRLVSHTESVFAIALDYLLVAQEGVVPCFMESVGTLSLVILHKSEARTTNIYKGKDGWASSS